MIQSTNRFAFNLPTFACVCALLFATAMTPFGVLAVLGLLLFLAGPVLSGVHSATNGLPEHGSGRQIFITSMSLRHRDSVITFPVISL